MKKTTKSRTRRRVTASAVAELADVSVSAVSRAFTPGASVSEETRKKILEAAAAVGYRPSVIARSMITQRTNLLGILVRDFRNPFYLQVLEIFTEVIQQNGFHSLVMNVGQEGDLTEAVQMVMQYEVDGLIVTSATLPPALARQCARTDIPVVLFGRYDVDAATNAVCCDNVAGGRAAAEILLERGYRRAAFIGGLPSVSTTVDRRRGFLEGLTSQNIELWSEESGGDHSYSAGYDAARRLMQLRDPPDSIFCVSDISAMGAMDAVRHEFRRRVPEDVGIVGFDDIVLAGSQAYNLTTIRQPIKRMVDLTTQLLVAQIGSPDRKPKLRFLSGELVVRNSVRPR